MDRTVKHFDLHQVADTELHVVSDVEAGVLPVIDAEDAVIRRYAECGIWRHKYVDLFILHDLQPLAERLQAAGGLPPGGPDALDRRPVVNAYDLADLTGCHVFVNQTAMTNEGYWGDAACLRALLAHEHAHPLSENAATRASRGLRVSTRRRAGGDGAAAMAPAAAGILASARPAGEIKTLPVQSLLVLLAEKLCCYAPREVFANDLVIASGFGDELLALDERVVASAAAGIAGRDELAGRLAAEVAEGRLSAAEAEGLSLVGDLRGYLDIALEVAPFRRAGLVSRAWQLEDVLESQVFPRLEASVAGAYRGLCDLYVELRPDLAGAALLSWARAVLDLLAATLRSVALPFRLELGYAADEEGKHV